jgi:erythromycin esterase-like protein
VASHPADAAPRLRQARTRTAAGLVDILREHAEPLPASPHSEEFVARFDRFGAAKVVLLGESTHGTAEFYEARAAITRRLIERHGFSIVAVEADWPDAGHIDAYVRALAPRPNRAEAFARFPQWMWRNEQFAAFVDWLRTHNRDLREAQQVSFRGLDLYSLGASVAVVLEYLERRDSAQAAQARQRYGCLTPWQQDPASYGLQVAMGQDPCEQQVVAQLQALLAQRLAYLQDDGEAFFDAAQNARVVRSAEQYYRALYRSSAESWNLRDRHMFDTLQAVMKEESRRRGVSPAAVKAVVWAHNSHIGNAAATAMGWQGEFNIGELCRNAYEDQAALIGFGTDRGTVAAASDWGGAMQIKSVQPARHDSYEHAFREAGCRSALTHWRAADRSRLEDALSASLLERAIGVIYRPQTELQSHYFESVMSEQFDAWVWFEETSAVTALPAGHAAGAPDTYPFGM